MSPIAHVQWKNKVVGVEVPTDLYFNKCRELGYRVASSPLVPFFSPLFVLATHFRRRRMSDELCRNELWPNTKSFFYKGGNSAGM